MDEDKIVLDRKSFEALAVDSRIRILKSLKERRKTLSEISKEQKMSLSGVKEHLETLEGVGLIVKKDDGHKWKYYELTRKGMEIVGPRELRVWILLSLSTIALAASMLVLLSPPGAVPGDLYGADAPPERVLEPGHIFAADAEISAAAARDAEAMPAPDGKAEAVEADAAEPKRLPAAPLAVAGISALTLLGCLAVLVRNRVRVAP